MSTPNKWYNVKREPKEFDPEAEGVLFSTLGWRREDFQLFILTNGLGYMDAKLRHIPTGFVELGASYGGDEDMLKNGLLRKMIRKVLDYEASRGNM